MKIILLSGLSGSGKTTIAKKLCEKYPDKYHFVNSYTDRQKREKNEWGHTFVDSKYMDKILERNDIVAQTTIEKNRYCTTIDQFDKYKVNLYTVDEQGVEETYNTFSDAFILLVLIRRNEVEADCVRIKRDVQVPMRDTVDFLIDNNGTVESAANLLNAIVNFDFFSVKELDEKIKYIDMHYRFLDEMRGSVCEQIWYNNLSLYIELCDYVEEKINKDFDFKITVHPDTSPEIVGGELTYNVQGEYGDADLTWDEINRLVERLSHHSYIFCKNHNCQDMMFNLAISEHWIGEQDYM